jgi:hypothetical protein
MLAATFLGWQSWLFESRRGRLLVDPILVPKVGRGPEASRVDFHFWPPRESSWEKLPPIDAVLITHEHEDHFSVASLALLDRAIPMYLSALSSSAAQCILEELGFRVVRVSPGDSFSVEDLTVRLFGASHVEDLNADEWDTLPFAVIGGQGDGVFFTNVDVDVSAETERSLREVTGSASTVLQYARMTVTLSAEIERASGAHHAPKRTVSRVGKREEVMSRLEEGSGVLPNVGQTFVLESGRLADVTLTAPYVRSSAGDGRPPPRFWPHPKSPLVPVMPLRPSPSAHEEVESALGEVARHLYGSPVFRGLYSLTTQALGGRARSFAWLLLTSDDGDALAFEYRPTECAFVALESADGIEARYAGVVLCWLEDFLAVARGEIEPRNIVRGFRESWSVPQKGRVLTDVLWPLFHPLRHPERVLAQYRRVHASVRDEPVLVRGRPAAKRSCSHPSTHAVMTA